MKIKIAWQPWIFWLLNLTFKFFLQIPANTSSSVRCRSLPGLTVDAKGRAAFVITNTEQNA